MLAPSFPWPSHPPEGLRRAHEEVKGKSHNKQETEGGGEGLVSRGGHEYVLILIDADHVIGDRGCVDVMPGDGSCWKEEDWRGRFSLQVKIGFYLKGACAQEL